MTPCPVRDTLPDHVMMTTAVPFFEKRRRTGGEGGGGAKRRSPSDRLRSDSTIEQRLLALSQENELLKSRLESRAAMDSLMGGMPALPAASATAAAGGGQRSSRTPLRRPHLSHHSEIRTCSSAHLLQQHQRYGCCKSAYAAAGSAASSNSAAVATSLPYSPSLHLIFISS
ncbi:hypothetical protein PENTCL1PPCAC_30776, partial [Pristionchus entomophagus]